MSDSLLFFSEGAGLGLLLVGLLSTLVVIGVLTRRSKRRDYLGQILVPSTLIAISLLFLVITFGFPSEEEAGPSDVPRLWIFWTCILNGIILLQIYRGRAEPDPKSGRTGFLLLVTALLLGYYFAMEIVGYFISSFLFLVLLMHVLAFKKKWIIYLIASGRVLFSYLVFYRLLYIQLPLGLFEPYF